jgi:hypothetical protein|tara:strand:+ start:4539 stop:4874 length:336 start_codon:yes stop_codon:yes gene_type:complete
MKSKYYYDYTRNMDTTEASSEELKAINDRLFKNVGNNISVPSYYVGSNGYEARKVISGFDLSYNVGTATSYLLRCGKKKEEGMTDKEKHIEDIEKAINHLRFELEKLRDEC